MKAILRAAFVCAIVAFASSAQAQTTEDPAETARFRWGPIRFTPTLEINSIGRDSNVFNEVEDPKSDFTAAIGPAVRLWIRPLRTRFSLTTGGQYLYFKEFADQRAWNTNNELKWEVPLARMTPFVAGTFVNSRERQGYEIDARARRRDRSYTLGSSLRLGGKTELVGSFRRAEMDYDDQETPFGAILAEELNRREDSSTLQFRYALTPLTTFVTNVALSRDRFDLPNIRDSDSLEIMPGFELKPLALISGNVFVGYKRFEPLDTTLTEYAGVVAAVKAKYTYSATKFELDVNRDVAYSFEATQPYYALLDYGLTVTERVAHRWELVGQASLQRLAYTTVETASAPAAEPQRTDRGRQFGGGIGYRLNETVRIGFNVYRVTRKSSQELRSFEGTRIFGSVTYGIQQ